MATTRLTKWGNSTGVRIPKCMLDMLGIRHGDNVQVRLTENGEILIARVNAQRAKAPAAAPRTGPYGGYSSFEEWRRAPWSSYPPRR